MTRGPCKGIVLEKKSNKKYAMFILFKKLWPAHDPYGSIFWTGVVHHSVKSRGDVYNPPKSLKMVDDDGCYLDKGFS